MKIIIVGAGGYIGTKLWRQLGDPRLLENAHISGVDLGVWGSLPRGVARRDVASVKDEEIAGAYVVWLASFHTAPEPVDQTWRKAYREVMVDEPMRWASLAAGFVYVSSMRALTHPENLYGETKRTAESRLHTLPNTSVLRFGTVWGPVEAGPHRSGTAINAAIHQEDFYGSTWSGYTTYSGSAVRAIIAELSAIITTPVVCEMTNITDTPRALGADDVRDLLAGRFPCRIMQERFRQAQAVPVKREPEEEIEAQCNMRRYYGLD